MTARCPEGPVLQVGLGHRSVRDARRRAQHDVFLSAVRQLFGHQTGARDAMGTVYGMDNIQQPFTGTFIISFLVGTRCILRSWRRAEAVDVSALDLRRGGAVDSSASTRPSNSGVRKRRPAGWRPFYYLGEARSTCSLLPAFWTSTADLFSRTQAKRLFGFAAAGGHLCGGRACVAGDRDVAGGSWVTRI